MINQFKLSCVLLLFVSTSFAQEAETTIPRWEIVALGTPVFNNFESDDSKGARFSLEVGRLIKPNLSIGLRPSYEFHGNRAIRGALQVYGKYRKAINPKANWYVETQLGYGFEELYVATVYSPGVGQESIIILNHERLIWETRLDVAIGIDFYLFPTIQGVFALNSGQGFEFGLRKAL